MQSDKELGTSMTMVVGRGAMAWGESVWQTEREYVGVGSDVLMIVELERSNGLP